MREAANPRSAALITGSFVSSFSGALLLVSVEDRAIGGILFSCFLLIGLVLLIAGLILSWRTRQRAFEFTEPSERPAKIMLRIFRIASGLVLFGAGCFMLYLTFRMYALGEGFPWMGFLWGVLLIPFGLRGIKNGFVTENTERTNLADRDSGH